MAIELAYYLSLAFILILGAVTSFDDIKKNRISNGHIIAALVLAFSINIIGSFLAPAQTETKMQYIQTTLINASISLLVGFALWYLRLWRAGDGKLFFAYSFLFPISVYYYGYIQHFPSFAILINTFIPLFLVLALNSLIKTSNDEKFEILKDIATPQRLFYSLLSLISAQWILSILFRNLLSIEDLLTTGSISAILLTVLVGSFQQTLQEFSIPIVLLRLLLDYNTMASSSFVNQIPLLFAFFLSLEFITRLSSFRFNERVRINDLKAGMCCADRITRKGKHYVLSHSESKSLHLNYDDLKEADIRKLLLMHKKGRLKFAELVVRQTVPFAPFLFLGVLLTILIRGDIITYSKMVLSIL